MPITTVADLHEHVALAVQVELSTVPPYLYALHSIEDQTSEAALLIRSIVVEEMLHAALATNLLVAVGGEPDFASTAWMPAYPGLLPHHTPPLELGLEPATPGLIRNVFMRIEQPEVHGSPPEPDMFETLGQFYHAIEVALHELDSSIGLFSNPQVSRQMGDAGYYSPVDFDAEDSGGLVAVTDLESAFEAIEIIVHQGEGLSTERWADALQQELTHYYKLLDIAEGKSPLGAVRPVPSNPRIADYPDGVRDLAGLFNAVYRYTFVILSRIYEGGPEQPAWVGRLYRCMSDVLQPLADRLVTLPLEGGVAAPTFEVHDFGDDPDGELLRIAGAVRDAHPEVESPVATLEAICSPA